MLSSDFINSCITFQPDFLDKILFIDNQYFDNGTLIVADENTKQLISFKGNFKLIILPSKIKPEIKWVNYIRRHTYKNLLAFGSGTINDICKYASFLDKTNFITCPTAPSVNGYSSSTASIIIDGVKKSCQAHLPKKIYISPNILANAPIRLILSGFSEVMCKFTTKFDWLLSHLLLGTYYTDIPFNLTKNLEEQLIDKRIKLINRDPKTILTLMEILLLSGLGMNISGGSYPWSQSEHQIVHTMEIHGKNNNYFHGEKIGVATITSAKVQNFILSKRLKGNFLYTLEKKIMKYYKTPEQHMKIFQSKHDNLNLKNWPEISDKIGHIIIKNGKLQDLLLSVGAHVRPEKVGWTEKQYQEGCEVALAMRNRFTSLDLLPYITEEFNFC
ncbi:MAG: iron-containing alcohol dehydrogenase [Rickettsiaceae bacterium H1]|nr:iron-containing alcohol dehydrogenase [Rickettsiaceae bacterium H1]